MYRYEQANPFKRFVRLSAGWKPMSLFYARTLHHIDRLVYRATHQRATLSGWIAGLPVVNLTTTGAKSGLLRTLPLLAIPRDDGFVVIASNYGQRRHPAWYHNLKAIRARPPASRGPRARWSRGSWPATSATAGTGAASKSTRGG